MSRLVALLALCSLSLPMFAADGYLSLGGGWERSSSMTLTDADCSSTTPPALFGCGAGADERPFAARGDAGRTPVFELGAGRESGRLRYGVTLSGRSGLSFDGESNFLGVTGEQPVRADIRSVALTADTAVTLAPQWRVHPLVTAGAGVARNSISHVVFRFPSIAEDAVTITQGGASTSFAWTAGAGASIAITSNLALDFTWRYTDLGDVETDAGSATIVRPTRRLEIEIAGTRMQLKTSGVVATVRWHL